MTTILGDEKRNTLSPDYDDDSNLFKIFGFGGNDTIYGGDDVKNILDGGTGNDTIYGGYNATNIMIGGDGNDKLYGSYGDDKITGGMGRDNLYSSGGNDLFIFNAVEEIGRNTGARDIIWDFKDSDIPGRARIDFSKIDANENTRRNEAFSFIKAEGAKFTDKAGELTWDKTTVAGHKVTIIAGDVDGDGIADFKLQLDGHLDLVRGDFIV